MSGGAVDRIGVLPDDILLHILSFLPSKTVVAATTTLSRRWRDLWHLCDGNLLPAEILTCSRLLLLNLNNFIVDRLPFLKTLHIDGVGFAKGEYLEIILSASPNIHHLQIKGLDLHPSFIPLAVTFTNLIHMELFVSQFNWFWIAELLNSSPLLQVLDVEGEDSAGALGLPDQPFPQIIPGCLSSHLRACTLRNFDGTDISIQFVAYILQNARVLDIMTIYCPRSTKEDKCQMLIKINKLPRISPTCGVCLE